MLRCRQDRESKRLLLFLRFSPDARCPLINELKRGARVPKPLIPEHHILEANRGSITNDGGTLRVYSHSGRKILGETAAAQPRRQENSRLRSQKPGWTSRNERAAVLRHEARDADSRTSSSA